MSENSLGDVEPQETYEEAKERLSFEIDNGQKMKRLLDNKDFVDLFEEQYIKAFAVTNVYNMAVYDEVTRARTMEKMVARSVFTKFIEGVIGQGNVAVRELQEIGDDLAAAAEEAEGPIPDEDTVEVELVDGPEAQS